MSTLTTHTTASRDSHSLGLCKFNTTTNAIEVSDGTNWRGYNNDSVIFSSNSYSGEFDGISDYVLVGNMSELNTSSDFSVSAWFNLSAASNLETIISSGTSNTARMWIQFPSSTSIRIGVNAVINDFTVPTLTVNGTQWYHLVATLSGTTSSLYLNKSLIGTGTSTTASSTSFNDVRLGILNLNAFSNTRPFNGNLDEIAIYNRAITSTEVTNIYDDKLYLNPTAMYRFETDVSDETGNYDGTNNGVTVNDPDKPY